MGWWSAHITGGDSPLDTLANIAEVCGVEFDEKSKENFHLYPFTKEVLDKNKKNLEKYLKDKKDPLYKSIGYQLVGLLFMRYGVKINQKFKKEIIDNAKKDEWYNECLQQGDTNAQRVQEIEGFIKQFEKFDGNSRYVPIGKGTFGEYKCLDPNSVKFIQE